MLLQQPSLINLEDVLSQVRDSLLLHHPRGGAVKIVFESEAGEEMHVLKIGSCSTAAVGVAPDQLRLPHLRSPPGAPSLPSSDNQHRSEQPDVSEHGLAQVCREQQRRILELELHLQQAQDALLQHAPSCSSLASHQSSASPASSTEADDSSSGSDSPHSPSAGEMSDTGHTADTDAVTMLDDADGSSQSSSSVDAAALPHSPPASDDPAQLRRSQRSKASSVNVNPWRPPTQHIDSTHGVVDTFSSSHKRRKSQRHQQPQQDNSTHMAVESMDSQRPSDEDDEDEAAEVAALVVKLREGYDRRESIALDCLSTESVLSLRRQVLEEEEATDRMQSVSDRITSLISTSISTKMVGHYLRALLAYRLKRSSHKCYVRRARDMLGIKSPADIAAYPALYELVQHHHPTCDSAGVEVWLQSPIFLADLTWSEWKRYLTKPGRAIIDAALLQFHAAVDLFQDWMQLGWVEVYDEELLGGKGVRALRDIHMPRSRAKKAQRDLAASISVVAADLHCAGSEFVHPKDATLEADRVYLLQLDRLHVFDSRCHPWIGSINHLPMPHCNLRLTSGGKLVQITEIAAGDALTFDYGVEYWVYRLSGLELSEWLTSSSVVSNRGTLDLFRRMHESVRDYSDLLRCGWVTRRPAMWSELERELWMEQLGEYLEAG